MNKLCPLAILLGLTLSATPALAEEDLPFELTSLVYDGRTVSMHGVVNIDPAARGRPKDAPVFVGLSLFKADGTAIDLPAKKLTGVARQGPVQIQGEVGRGIIGYIATAWWKKVKPCKVDRPGCKKLGYVLDEPILPHPSDAYDGWEETIYERFPGGTGRIEVRILDAGAKPIVLRSALFAVHELLKEHLKVFGRTHQVKLAGEAKNPRQVVEILYRHKQDEQLAVLMRTAIKQQLRKPQPVQVVPGEETVIQVPPRPKYKLTHWPQAPANFVIAAGRKSKKK